MKNLEKLLDQLALKIYLGGEGSKLFTAVEDDDTRIEVDYSFWDDDLYFKSFEITHYFEEDCVTGDASTEIEDKVIDLVNDMAA